jgi:hypothetical protein
MKKQYIVCTANLEWVDIVNNRNAIGPKVKRLLNKGYKKSCIKVFVKIS